MDWGWGLGLEKDEPEGFYGSLNIIQDTLEVTMGTNPCRGCGIITSVGKNNERVCQPGGIEALRQPCDVVFPPRTMPRLL